MTRGRKPGTIKCENCHKFHSGRCRCDYCGELGQVTAYHDLTAINALCSLCAKDYSPDGFQGLPRDCPGCLTKGTIQINSYGNSKGSWKLTCRECQSTYHLTEGKDQIVHV